MTNMTTPLMILLALGMMEFVTSKERIPTDSSWQAALHHHHHHHHHQQQQQQQQRQVVGILVRAVAAAVAVATLLQPGLRCHVSSSEASPSRNGSGC
jgi:UDP-N-acetylmuramyl pentapeptide phosphotransferase/UDP-N-acetylglucosamine-1-phosphate transferase